MTGHTDTLEKVVQARTEQLRAALKTIEELCAALEPFRPEVVKTVRERIKLT